MKVTTIEAKSLQELINRAARKLEASEINFGYKHNMGITILQLQSTRGGFDLGISKEVYGLGPEGAYAPMLISWLSGKPAGEGKVETVGVDTKGRVEYVDIANRSRKWLRYASAQLGEAKKGDAKYANWIAYPFAKYTTKERAHQPCMVYIQYHYWPAKNSATVIVNFRAQHLYMVAINTQFWAFQLLQLCEMNKCEPGGVVLNCNHHHVKEDEDPTVVIGEPLAWHVKPKPTKDLVSDVIRYYEQFEN